MAGDWPHLSGQKALPKFSLLSQVGVGRTHYFSSRVFILLWSKWSRSVLPPRGGVEEGCNQMVGGTTRGKWLGVRTDRGGRGWIFPSIKARGDFQQSNLIILTVTSPLSLFLYGPCFADWKCLRMLIMFVCRERERALSRKVFSNTILAAFNFAARCKVSKQRTQYCNKCTAMLSVSWPGRWGVLVQQCR